MVELVCAKTELRRVGHALDRPVPVPRRAHARRSRSTPSEKLYLLLRLPGGGRRRSASSRRRRASTSARRSSSWPTATASSSSSRTTTRRRERAPAPARAAARRCSTATADFYAALPVGLRTRRRGARDYLEGRGLRSEVLREFGVGYAPSAWDRVLRERAARRASREQELEAAGLAQRGREGGLYDRFRGADHVPAARRAAAACSASARARCARTSSPKYLNTPENEVYHKGRQLFGIDLARAARRQERSDRRGRGLHRRAGAAPGRVPRLRGDHGHRADRRADGRAGPRCAAWSCWPSTPTARARRRCCGRAAAAGRGSS